MSEFKIHHLVNELFSLFNLPDKLNEDVSANYFSEFLLKNRTPNIASKISTLTALKKLAENSENSEKVTQLYDNLKSRNIRELEPFIYLLACITTDDKILHFLRSNSNKEAKSLLSCRNGNLIESEVVNLRDKLQSMTSKSHWPPYQSNKENLSKRNILTNVPHIPSWIKERPYQSWNFSFNHSYEKNVYGNLGMLPSKAQESLLIDDLLYCLMGIDGEYICPLSVAELNSLQVVKDETIDPSLKEFVKRIFPLCYHYSIVIKFIEEKSRYEYGLVNHALAAAYRNLLKDYFVLIAQLEHQHSQHQLSLQKFWLFIQPTLRTMEVLASLATSINKSNAFGGSVLSILHERTSALTGDPKAQEIGLHLTQAACVPYFEILEKWIYKGIICDPYLEFLVEDNEHGKKDELSHDFCDDYWEKRYRLCRDRIPLFLESVADMILRTGKYLNVIRQCGEVIKCPFAESLVYTMSERLYVIKIESAYKFASKKLLDMLMKGSDLLGRLRSLKHYFLMDQGDFIVQFLDMAEEELSKEINDIILTRLESLVELALRTSVVNSDRYKDDVRVELFPYDLLSQMFKILRIQTNEQKDESTFADLPVTGLEAFAFDYEVRWPLSLVLSRKVLACYQMLFRHLLYCKHVERVLGNVWLLNNSAKSSLFKTATFATAFALRQRMLNFIQNLEYYMMFEVIEPSWLNFVKKMHEVTNVDDVLACHSDFLDSCLKDCMLTHPDLLQTIRKLLKFCIAFADFMQATHSKEMDGSLHMEKPVTQEKIEDFQKEFTSSLLSLLTLISDHGQDNCNDKMVNMLYRLDLNGFYSKNFSN